VPRLPILDARVRHDGTSRSLGLAHGDHIIAYSRPLLARGGEDAGDCTWAQATGPSRAANTADVSMTKTTWLGNLASVAVAAMFRPASAQQVSEAITQSGNFNLLAWLHENAVATVRAIMS
jgi:hypothetical protein